MRKLILSVALMLTAVLSARAQFEELQTIEIGTNCTTHVLFTSDLTYVDISKSDIIAAKVVDASKNILALKAKDRFDYVTTISTLEANGTMHTFKVRFNPYPDNLIVDTRNRNANAEPRESGGADVHFRTPVPDGVQGNNVNVTSEASSNFGRADAPTLEEIVAMPQQIFHVGDKNFKLEAYCTNVFVYSDQIYIVLSVINNSDIGFEAGDAQFAIENNVRNKKTMNTDKDIWAKSSYGSLSCAPKSRVTVGYTIPKFTLLKGETLSIYIYEKKGNRNLILSLSDKDINYAISPKK